MMMMKALLVAAVATAALSAAPAFAADKPSFVKKGGNYQSIRKKLKAKWTPAGEAMREQGACPDDDSRCNYPEARDCSGTGLGFCNMVWEHKQDGSILVITTVGDESLSVHRASIE